MKRLFFGLIFSLLAAGISSQAQQVLLPEAFAQRLKTTPQAQLLDVRTLAEFEAGHLPKALNVDWKNGERFAQQVARLDKSRPVFVYCQVGGRSKAAAAWLAKQGFRQVYELQSGYRDWTGEKEAPPGALPRSEKP